MTKSKPLSLYIHIPFCVRKCLYCDFLSFPTGDSGQDGVSTELQGQYMAALTKEIEYYGQQLNKEDYEIETIFIGGGTPSCIEPVYITSMMALLRNTFHVADDAEITLEANPGTVTRTALSAYHAADIHRLSIGLQSADNKELKLLGRIHTWEQFETNYQEARACGFSNINIDIMTALPGQNCDRLRKTLMQVIKLCPEHISAYSLIIEAGTPFADLYGRMNGTKGEMIPDEEEDRQMYAMTQSMLNIAGYHQYEISNYAKEGYESRHNKVYWQRGEYLGLGLGASSLMHENRWKNESNMTDYIQQFKNGEKPKRYEQESLTTRMQMEEFMFLGLRMTRGISVQEFKQCFRKSLNEVYGQVIEELLQEGLLSQYNIQNEQYIQLTPRGIDISNYVFGKFL